MSTGSSLTAHGGGERVRVASAPNILTKYMFRPFYKLALPAVISTHGAWVYKIISFSRYLLFIRLPHPIQWEALCAEMPSRWPRPNAR